MTSKELSIKAYRQATGPIRSMLMGRYRAQKKIPISVLYYHRVADWQPTPWTIGRETFQQHIEWLQNNFDLISLDTALDRIEAGENDRPAVVITFDDGYADNMDFAVPFLVQQKIPFTYYVSTHQVVNQQPFEHDRVYPSRLYPNSVRDLKKLVRWGVDIGAHTCHHVDLGQITDEKQLRTELRGCRKQLMNLLGCPVKHFAFPFGQRANISTQAVALAKEAGFRSIAGAYGGYNFMGQDPFLVQRFHGDPLLARVQNWVSLDPRFLSVRPNPEWLEVPADSACSGPICHTDPFNLSFPVNH